MKFQDYYQVLGVERDADEEQIKKAYRRLALEWHPDRHKSDTREEAEARFRQISEAYEVLSDSEKRAKYDQFGENWRHGEEFTPPPGTRTMSPEEFEQAFGGMGGFSDFFTGMFGDRFRHDFGQGPRRHERYRYRGADVRAELSLPIGAALAGGKSSFEIPTTAPCSLCGGVGFVEQHVCPTCAGVGAVHDRKTVELKIPDDPYPGMTLRLRGLGEPGEGGAEAGDLLLTIRLEDDATYRLRGGDLETDVNVAPWDALLGSKVDVRTARGVASVTIPPETQAGAKLRLRGQGLVDGRGGRGGRGDVFVIVRLALPEDLSERQRDLLRQLAETQDAAKGGRS